MGRFKFLAKPLFYIFSLLFSCWMVLQIERISPSDFGKYKSWFQQKPTDQKHTAFPTNTALRDAYLQYKSGKTDSATFFRFIEEVTGINKEENRNAK